MTTTKLLDHPEWEEGRLYDEAFGPTPAELRPPKYEWIDPVFEEVVARQGLTYLPDWYKETTVEDLQQLTLDERDALHPGTVPMDREKNWRRNAAAELARMRDIDEDTAYSIVREAERKNLFAHPPTRLPR